MQVNDIHAHKQFISKWHACLCMWPHAYACASASLAYFQHSIHPAIPSIQLYLLPFPLPMRFWICCQSTSFHNDFPVISFQMTNQSQLHCLFFNLRKWSSFRSSLQNVPHWECWTVSWVFLEDTPLYKKYSRQATKFFFFSRESGGSS